MTDDRTREKDAKTGAPSARSGDVARGRGGQPAEAKRSAVDAFLSQVASLPAVHTDSGQGRLIFALDATMSRQPTWDQAMDIQVQMFNEADSLGGLKIQLVYFRGFGEFYATSWLARSADMVNQMSGVRCRGGQTQIERVLRHAQAEAKTSRVAALVYVGDCVEEDADRLCRLAGELGIQGVRAFVFQEGDRPDAQATFSEIARLTGGAYCRFDAGSAKQLRELLAAVAVYAAGGRRALQDFSRKRGGEAVKLLGQIR